MPDLGLILARQFCSRNGPKFGDLGLEFARGGAPQGDLVPDHARRRRRRGRRQPGRLGVVHVGEDERRSPDARTAGPAPCRASAGRPPGSAPCRRCRTAYGESGRASSASPAPAPCRRRRRRRIPAAPAAADAGWTSSSATRSAITRFSLQVWTNSRYFCRFSKKRKLPRGSRFSGGTSRPRGGGSAARRGGRDIGLDAIQRIDGDALALAQPVHQLAVVDRPAAKRRLRHVGLAAEVGDLAEDLVVLHRAGFGKRRWAGRDDWRVLPPSAHHGYGPEKAAASLEPVALANIQDDKLILRGENVQTILRRCLVAVGNAGPGDGGLSGRKSRRGLFRGL